MTTTVTPMHAWNRHLSKLLDCGCEHCERNYAHYKAALDAMHFERFGELLTEHGYTAEAGIASMDDVNPNHKKNRRRK